ncbi:MAG TPA: UDP-glucuronic acid decarboxylase family protein [Acidimicrobiia bacterium]|nr:UDP-glucuronic acid decarboxylase family protein [Acidimicrobiia bacterium]
MRALITGGAGFLGSHLCRSLLDRGWDVVAVDNTLTGRVGNISDLLTHERFTFVHYDVTNYVHVPGELDAVLHFASPASPRDYLEWPIETLKVGSIGTHVTLGLAKEKGARYLLASTSEVYGDPLVTPQSEQYWGNVNPVGLRGVYDEAKRFSEALAMAYHRRHGLDVKIARIFNTYGPRLRVDDGRAVPNFLAQAILGEPITVQGDGHQTRSFCYVDDMVAGLTALLESDWVGPMNIGNPEEFSVMELARLVLEITGSDSEIVFQEAAPDDPKLRRPDISLARRRLGWDPKVSLREGLGRTHAWLVDEVFAQPSEVAAVALESVLGRPA